MLLCIHDASRGSESQLASNPGASSTVEFLEAFRKGLIAVLGSSQSSLSRFITCLSAFDQLTSAARDTTSTTSQPAIAIPSSSAPHAPTGLTSMPAAVMPAAAKPPSLSLSPVPVDRHHAYPVSTTTGSPCNPPYMLPLRPGDCEFLSASGIWNEPGGPRIVYMPDIITNYTEWEDDLAEYYDEMQRMQFPKSCVDAKFFGNRLRRTGFGYAFSEFLLWASASWEQGFGYHEWSEFSFAVQDQTRPGCNKVFGCYLRKFTGCEFPCPGYLISILYTHVCLMHADAHGTMCRIFHMGL